MHTADNSMALPGTVLAGYTLEERIGEGASGQVWQARRQGQTVAIKMMHASLAQSPEHLLHFRRFRAETLALSLLQQQSGIPHLIEANLDAVPPYFVMSLVEGISFAEAIASGAMLHIPILQRLQSLHQVAATLDAVHQQGLLHRDVKPSNIRGWSPPYLLDFSISVPLAKAAEANPHAGTKLYMPPETNFVQGTYPDIYAFALVCYEVLFGRHALFTRHEIDHNLRSLAQHKLQHGNWYRAATMSEAELPIYLHGVELEALDSLFHEAFTNHNPMTAAALITQVEALLLTESNQPFLPQLPGAPLTPMTDALPDDVFTEHEVALQASDTSHDVPASSHQILSLPLTIAILGVLMVLTLLVLGRVLW